MSAIAMVSRFIMIEPKYSKSEPAIFISVGVLRRQLLQQRLRLLQIARVEPLRKPPVNRSQAVRALAAPCPGRARGVRGSWRRGVPRTLLAAGARPRARSKYASAFAHSVRRHQRDFAGHAMDLGLAPSFLGCFHCGHRLADAAPSVIELAEFRIGPAKYDSHNGTIRLPR